MTKKELEQVNKIKGYGYTILKVIDVEGYKCAVVAEIKSKNCVRVIPFDENKIYPLQYAMLDWKFISFL